MAVFSGPEVVNDGLVLHLDAANDRSYPGSGTTWSDLSKSNNSDSSLLGGVTIGDNSFVLDGTDDYISVSHPGINASNINNGIDTYTIEIWFRMLTLPTADFASNNPIYGSQIGTNYMILCYPETNLGVSYDDSRFNDNHKSTKTITANEWVQFVHVGIPHVIDTGALGIRNVGKLKYYVNGQLDREEFTSSDPNGYSIPNPMFVGRDTRWNVYSHMEIACIKHYDRELTADEIKQNFEATRSRYGI